MKRMENRISHWFLGVVESSGMKIVYVCLVTDGS